MTIQWFPGHMAKTKRMILDQLKLVDVVIELVDARLPMSSRNPLLDQLIGQKKPRVIILNKEDLADPNRTAHWLKVFRAQEDCYSLSFNATLGKKRLIAELKEAIDAATAAKRKRLEAKGVRHITTRCMIVGIPNVGKSTFINILVGKKSAKTGDKPGVTRGTQWLKVAEGLDLLDTPGILWPKFEDQEVGYRLALSGAISDDVFVWEEGAIKLIAFLKERYPRLLTERYQLGEEVLVQSDYDILLAIGQVRGCLLKGGRIDEEKVARLLIREFRDGKIGRITME